MITRFKFVAALLGLAVAAAAIGDASAKTITAPVAGKIVHKTTKLVAHKPHRVVVGKRIVKHLHLVHRAPAAIKVVHAPAPAKTVHIGKAVRVTKSVHFAKSVRFAKTVRLVKRPILQRQALAHRTLVKKTIIR